MIEVSDLEKVLNTQGFVVGNVKGQSMYPFLIENKHRVIITKVDPNKIKKYDVVLYKVNNSYILHRVIDIDNETLLIRGDNTLVLEHIKKSSILGILTAYYDNNKCIDITDDINLKNYNKSIKTYNYRLLKYNLKNKIKKLLHIS